MELIAQKHASLMIQPQHYPIVGANLLASIQEVLGAGATEDVLAAWAEAYAFLADLFIGREQQIYRENAEKPGGWEGFKAFQVLRKEPESSNITSFYLAPSDGAVLPDFKPGQYTTVRIATPEGQTTMRNYSLSDRPGQPHFRISVKREEGPSAPQGYISNWLHDNLQVGMELELAPPCGEFFLDLQAKSSEPLLFLAAGIGITPILSMLSAALEAMPEREALLIHGCLNEEVQAFRASLERLAEKHSNFNVHFRYSDPARPGVERPGHSSTGLVDAALLESLLPGRNADTYFCGPQPFMVGIYQQLLSCGLPSGQLHFEFFGPRQALENPKEMAATGGM